jgi:Uma2 family endonuclease
MKTEFATQRTWTDDELLALPENKFWQLIDGELIKMSPAGAEHGEICSRLLITVGMHVRRKKAGRVYDSSTGFRLDPDNCFSADVSFVKADRVASVLPNPEKFVQGAPDFAIEVLSPTDTVRSIERKIELFFRFGTQVMWFVLPRKRIVRLYTAATDYQVMELAGILRAEPVLPGLAIPVREVFEDPVFQE